MNPDTLQDMIYYLSSAFNGNTLDLSLARLSETGSYSVAIETLLHG